MNFFPAFIKLNDKKILIVGGGHIAYEKLTKLLNFTKDLTILANDIDIKIKKISKQHNIPIIKKRYESGDIKGFDIVIIAVDDIDLQREIFIESRNYRIFCNAVDSLKYCDFIFPSFLKEDDLIIAVSTSGASPSVAKYLRRYIQKLLPPNILGFLKEMKNIRNSLPKGKRRMELLDKKAKEFFKLNEGK